MQWTKYVDRDCKGFMWVHGEDDVNPDLTNGFVVAVPDGEYLAVARGWMVNKFDDLDDAKEFVTQAAELAA